MNTIFKSLTLGGWRQFENISIDFHPRLTVITGANGAGKSSLLNLLTQHFGWHRNFLGTPRKKRKNGNLQFFTGVRQLTEIPEGGQSVVGSLTYTNCLVPCDHIPRRSWPLFRAKAMLDELIAELAPRSSSHRRIVPESSRA